MLERSYEQQEAEGRIYEVIERTLSAHSGGAGVRPERAVDRAFARTTDAAVRRRGRHSTVVGLKFKVLIGLATACGTAAIVWLGAQSVLEGRLTRRRHPGLPRLPAALYGPLEALMYAPSTTQGAAGSARRVLEVLETRRDVEDRPDARPANRLAGHVRIEHVTFGYEPGRPCCATSASRCGPARPWPSSAPPAPARARSPASCRASTTRGAAGSRSTASTFATSS